MKNPKSSPISEVRITYDPPPLKNNAIKISNSKDAEIILREYWSNDISLLEESCALFLTRSHHVKALFKISRGGTTGTVIDPKILFSAALKGLASGIILAHNHPSGQHKPSQTDISLTKKLKEAGDLVDIPLLDHLILVPHSGYFSFADEGMI